MHDRRVTIERMGGWWKAATPWHPALRPYLRDYIGYWDETGAPVSVRTVPTGYVTVIVNLATPLRMVAMPHPGFRPVSPPVLVAGMDDGPGRYEHPGGQAGIQLDLTPLGAYRLFGLPMHEITNRVVGLSDLLGSGADALAARLAETPGWADRFDLLDALLLGRLAEGPEPSPEVGEAWRRLTSSGGLVTVADLAAEIGWSRKHLASRFREQVGLTPKAAARVLRFQRAMAMLTHGVPGFVDVAVACGYYDQAHFNREVRALTGTTPGRLLGRTSDEPD